jgi:hypothetical protein
LIARFVRIITTRTTFTDTTQVIHGAGTVADVFLRVLPLNPSNLPQSSLLIRSSFRGHLRTFTTLVKDR